MLSILRKAEYNELEKISVDGKILDIGGNSVSEYQSLIKGNHKFVSSNIDPSFGADMIFDIQKKFPIESATFDGAVCLNVLEHVFGYENGFKETFRVLKPGGVFVFSTPFMHHIHGCPDDYFRYTRSAIAKILSDVGFTEYSIKELGGGVFSLLFQSVSGAIPNWIKPLFQFTAVGVDKLCSVSARYRDVAKRLPLGYFVIARKT